MHREREGEGGRDREREIETATERYRDRDRQTDRQTQTDTDRQRESPIGGLLKLASPVRRHLQLTKSTVIPILSPVFTKNDLSLMNPLSDANLALAVFSKGGLIRLSVSSHRQPCTSLQPSDPFGSALSSHRRDCCQTY